VQFQFSNAVHGPEGPIAAPHTTPARARARSRRLRMLHHRRALNARRQRVRRALRALRQGRLRMARRIESKLFRGKRLKSLAVRRRRLVGALGPHRWRQRRGLRASIFPSNRWDHNLASLKQCALLKRFGYETKGVTREQAGVIIAKLKENGWRKPNGV
jgi:hypothetical protein